MRYVEYKGGGGGGGHNEMQLINMFPNLKVLADFCLTIPVGTASVERSFSHMKMIKHD